MRAGQVGDIAKSVDPAQSVAKHLGVVGHCFGLLHSACWQPALQ